MCTYVLIHIDCGLFEGYGLFYLNGINSAESIAVQIIHSVSTDKKQKIIVEWDESGNICHAFSQSANVRARVYAVSETMMLCEALADAFGVAECGDEKAIRQLELIYSLLRGPGKIKLINEMLMKRWVFADSADDIR